MKLKDRLKNMLNNENASLELVEENEEMYDNPKHSSDNSIRQSSILMKDNMSSQGFLKNTKVVDIHTTAKLQVVLKKPEHFDEATLIADELIDKRTVVLNLEATLREEAEKLICFLSGVAYSNGGKLKKIANNTYIITPYNVDVMGDLLDELESNGMFFI